LDIPLENQGPFDGILLKITEFVAKTDDKQVCRLVYLLMPGS